MAYKFASSSSQYLSASAPVTAAPFTVSTWLQIDNTTGDKAIVCLETGNDAQRWVLYVSGATIYWFVNQSSFTQASGGTVTANTWTHAAVVESAANSRVVYRNGTAGTANTTSLSPANVDELNIGVDRANSILYSKLSGQIADVGIWNVALTAAEIASLAKGVSCRLIRPQSLVFYAPLVRDLVDVRGGRTITNNNTATVADHPRIYA